MKQIFFIRSEWYFGASKNLYECFCSASAICVWNGFVRCSAKTSVFLFLRLTTNKFFRWSVFIVDVWGQKLLGGIYFSISFTVICYQINTVKVFNFNDLISIFSLFFCIVKRRSFELVFCLGYESDNYESVISWKNQVSFSCYAAECYVFCEVKVKKIW